MRIKLVAVILLSLAIFAPVLTRAQKKTMQNKTESAKNVAAQLPPINITEFKLANGLRVVFHEDHSTPIVAVNIWYHVGSKNEVPGRTGFAHLFEHMMFQGSKHYDKDYFGPLQEAGGTLNGSTNTDRTNYWEIVPSNFLELALWLESDRMGYLPDAMTMEKLNNQRDVVKNEKRQNYDNRPYGLVGAKIAEAMYPADHPYHWLTIGSLDDLNAASMDEVKDFFRRFYTPNNASLVIAGDFNPTEARRMVEKYFGALKRGPEVTPLETRQPHLDKEIRLTMEDRVSLPRLYITWHSMPQYTEDEAALDTVATILTNGKGSRLYRSLVYEKQIAQDVSAFNNTGELAGKFQIVVTAKPGTTLAELERAVDAELERIKSEPPTADEMERAYNARESAFIYGMETVGGFGGKSDQLNSYATFLSNPNYFQEDLQRYARVTPEDVRRAAQSYLTDKRLVLTVTPRAKGKTTGEPVAASPADAMPKPAEQTAGTQAGGSTTAAAAKAASTSGTQQGATTVPATDKPAGAQAQTKTEAAATRPAGATPPIAERPTGGQKETTEIVKQGGLYDAPKPGTDPRFALPKLQRRTLSNGLEVLIVEHHELPIVDMSLVLKTGGTADPLDRGGLASLTAALLDEGTKTRTSLDISNQLAAIGSSVGTGADWDLSAVNLTTLTKHLDRALGIYADVIINPVFPESELDLQRNQRLTALMQQRDNANAIAGVAYASLLYGRAHPYGHQLAGDEQSVRAIKLDDIKRFYQTYYHPNNAALIVVGDVKPNAVVKQLEKAFADWKKADVPTVNVTEPPQKDRAGLYLVDKPGAAQSVITIGQVGVARSTPDYFPLLVMNTILGGQFMSRVNLNLRESKGYTYGARTSFDFRKGAGPFVASAGVQTAVTKESVVEFMKELRGIRGEIPVTPEELEFAKQAIIRGYPRTFETPSQIANRLTTLVIYKLPDSYFNDFIPRIRAVTTDDVSRVANKYLDPSRMTVLVVGDRHIVESGLRSLEGLGGTLSYLDAEGKPLSGNSGGGSTGGGSRP
ncbi:MAG TPA: insulinase family protein [Pyrinomonadaceae bacterium]|jgi:predicted Zn-dependent peptidase